MIGGAVMGDVMMDDGFMIGVSNYLLPDNIIFNSICHVLYQRLGRTAPTEWLSLSLELQSSRCLSEQSQI